MQPVDLAAVLVLIERLRGAALAELDATPKARRRQRDGCGASGRSGRNAAPAALLLATRVRAELPALGDALRKGETTYEHVRAVAAGTSGLDGELVRSAQPALLDLVGVAEPGRVRRELRERAYAMDPALGRDAAERQRARWGFYADLVDRAGVQLGGSIKITSSSPSIAPLPEPWSRCLLWP